VRHHRLAIAGGAAAILATTTAVATSSAGTGSTGGWTSHVIRVERVAGPTVPVDVDNSGGATIGDEFVTGAEFFSGGRRVGDDAVVCTRVRAPETYQCLATNSFRSGDLTVQFVADFTRPGTGYFAITGGTRTYRGATGEVTYTDNPEPARDVVTFRFVTPR
jgi:hypothetical protein